MLEIEKEYLHWKVLILDVSFRPIRIVNWTRAMLMVLLNKAEALSYYQDVNIRSQYQAIPLPNVIKIRKYVKGHTLFPKFNRVNIFIRDEYTCQYCGSKEKPQNLTLDHVVPKARGGKKSWTNIVTCCIPCNQRKADMSLEETNMRLIREPFKLKKLTHLALKTNDPEASAFV